MDLQTYKPADWFEQTKFLLPPLKPDIVLRPRLTTFLQQSIASNRLTLISAPPGSGKTTLLASLPAVFPDLPLIWISLHDNDNDPIHFLAALLRSLRHFNLDLGKGIEPHLVDIINPTEHATWIVKLLINDVLNFIPYSFVIVLDDLHRITEPLVYQLLDYLLERLPPQMHLVIATRHDPALALPRLKVRGQVAQLRLAELRFTQSETVAFLNEKLGLKLSKEDLNNLYKCSEGWVAGLRILASSLDRFTSQSDRADFINELPISNNSIFEYLVEEVLNHQNETVRAFLLQTSILNELTPEICEAVTGSPGAAAMLRQLYRSNLFVVAVDEYRQVYRYHDLFSEFLRKALLEETSRDQRLILYRKAAYYEKTPGQAIRHYLAAELWDEAAQAIEQLGPRMLQLGLLNTLHDWIVSLPEKVQTVQPWLIYYLGVYAAHRGKLRQARLKLEQAQQGFIASGNELGQQESLVQLTNCLAGLNDFEATYRLLAQGLTIPSLPPASRVLLLNLKIWLDMLQKEWGAARLNLETALKLTLATGDTGTFTVMAHHMRAPVTLLPGSLDMLEDYCQEVLARFGDQVSLLHGGTYSLLGCLYLWRGRTKEAAQAVERSRVISQQLSGITLLEVEVDVVMAHYYLSRGEYKTLEEYLATHLPQLEHAVNMEHWIFMLKFLQAKAAWLRGQPEQCRQIYHNLYATRLSIELPGVEIIWALLKAMLEISKLRYAEAERILLPAVEQEQQTRFSTLFGSVRLLLAHLYLGWNRPRQALKQFEQTLTEAQNWGTPGFILKEGPQIIKPLLKLAIENNFSTEYANYLLSLLEPETKPEILPARVQPLRVPATGEILSSREIEVLQLMAVRASNREIATQLVISEQTVKSHVKNILSKLDLTSRREVASCAHELQLI